MTNVHSSRFMRQLLAAVSQLSSTLPSFPCRVLAHRDSVPAGFCGSYVSLSVGKTEHIVGLLSNTLGWESLSYALDQDLPGAESHGLVEGACKISKIVGEAFRARLGDASASVVGLPLFAEGLVSGGRRVEAHVADIALGGTLVLLVLFSRTQDSPSAARHSGSGTTGRAP